MKYFLLFLILPFQLYGGEQQFSGEIAVEYRYFFTEGLYANTDQSHPGIFVKPEYSNSWDEDRKVFSFQPFFRYDQIDNEKTHFDVRELSFVGAWDDWELRAGLSKVYWGVVESIHLVDVINQTDFVENADGEDKLGQLMINPSYISEDYGVFSLFLLPHFRERTFPGKDGRFRASTLINTDDPVYESNDEEWSPDWAARWSHYFGSLEIGLGYFQGTDREPQFLFDTAKGELVPHYVQTKQVSLDAQYIYEDWLFKLETIYKNSSFNDEFQATAYGFEYSFSNIWGGMDVGILTEHIYDERLDASTLGFYNHIFIGSRIAVNDANNAEFLFGGLHNNDTGVVESFRLEAARRINDNWKWELETNLVFEPPKSSLLYAVRADDYVQATLSYYF